MKFVTDLGKGILGAADNADLWSEIIGHIPNDVLTDPDTKILNVACGHLTEARLIVKRMMDLGVSAQEANSKIYVLDKYSTFTNAAEMQGYQNVIQADFTEWETDMKFDVVVGNPPYQNPNAKQVKLWLEFLKKSDELLKDDGYLAFLTPDVWVSDINKVAEQTRNLMSGKTLKLIDLTANDHFKVGESICSFVYQKTPNTNNEPTDVITQDGVESLVYDQTPLAITKEQKTEMTIFRKLSESDHDRTLLTRVDGNGTVCAGHRYDKQTAKRNIKVYFSYKDTFWTDLDFTEFQGPKLIFNNSGYYYKPGKEYIIKESDAVAGNNAHQLMLKSKKQVKNAYEVYTSNLYRFFVDTFKSGGFNCSIIRKLPMLDYNRSWTDQDLYKEFKLTKKEIEYIEKRVV